MIKLAIDFEHPSRLWWESGGQELWDGIAQDSGESSVVVEEAIAHSWLAQAAALPGWDGAGHEYAPHPVRSEPADPEDMDAI